MTGAFGRPRPRRSALRRILSLLLWLVVLLALLVALAPLALQGRARSELVEILERGFDAKVELESLSLGWTSGIDLERLVVRPKQGGEPWLEAKRARFAPSLLPLLRGRVRWHGTVLEDVVVRVERDERGEIAPRWRGTREPGERRASGQLEIEGDLPALDLDLRIEGLRVEVRDAQWRVPLIAEFSAPIRIHSPSARSLRLDALLGSRLPCVVELALEEVPRASEARAGSTALYEPRGVLRLDADDAPLAELEGLLAPWLASLEGRAQGRLEYRFTPTDLSGGGELGFADFTAASHTAGALPLPRALRFESALSGTPEEARHVLQASGEGLRARWSLTLDGRELAATELAGALDPVEASTWLPAHGPLAIEGGAIDFEAAVERAGAQDHRFRGALDTAHSIFYLGAEGRPMRGPGRLALSGRLVPGAALRVAEGLFEAPGIAARFEGDAAALALRADLDLDRVTSAWLENLGVGLLARGRASLELDLARLDTAATSGAGNALGYRGALRYRGGRITTYGIDASEPAFELAALEDGGFALRDGQILVNGGRASFSARLAPPAETGRPFEFALDAAGCRVGAGLEPELARILPLLAGAGAALDGAVDFELALQGDAADPRALLRTLSGDGVLAWQSAALRPSTALAEPLALLGVAESLRCAALRAPFRVDAGAVELPPLALRAGKLAFELAGRTSPDGALEHSLGVRLPESASRALGLLLEPGGLLRLPLRGTIAAPRFEMPPLHRIAEQGLEEALQRTLDQLWKRNAGRLGDALDPRKRK